MEKGDWAFIQELLDLYERTSLSDIISILPLLPLLIPLLILGSLPVVWAVRTAHSSAMKRFEEENPHLKGQYFSFWKWFNISGEHGNISTKPYKKAVW